MFLTRLNAEIVACIYYYSENRDTSRIWKVLPNMFLFSRFFVFFLFCFFLGGGGGGEDGGVLNMCMQVILDLSLDSLFARSNLAPIWDGKKGEFRDWTNLSSR